MNTSFGPDPWQQTNWDARAAGNFIGGGAGCGLLLFAWAGGAQGSLRAALLLAALALVGAGLLCVWAEIGRPLRAVNVMFNPRSSWMSRESVLAPLLFASASLALLGYAAAWPLAALVALGFVFCQGRILQAAKGVPAWREPLTTPLLVATGLAEGAGLYWAVVPWWGAGGSGAWIAFGLLLLLRFGLGVWWYRRLATQLRPRALQAVHRAGRVFNAGSLLPLAIVLAVLAMPPAPAWAATLQVLAGVLGAVGGALFKFTLVTRAGLNQGFALPHLPVRGVRR